MNKEFIPYEEALALKELGFNEPCLAFYTYEGKFSNELSFNEYKNTALKTSAPLYQQAFKWFREKYNWHHQIKIDDKSYYFYDCISNKVGNHNIVIQREHSKTYEDSELECLKKLIGIVKNK
jgi:hypothetical protein